MCSNFFFSTLILIPIGGCKQIFSTSLKKTCCSFAGNDIFEKSKMAVKMADMLWNDCCHSNSSLWKEIRQAKAAYMSKLDLLCATIWEMIEGEFKWHPPPPSDTINSLDGRGLTIGCVCHVPAEVNNIIGWSDRNKMSLNLTKTRSVQWSEIQLHPDNSNLQGK